jgi:hypothetical protein
MIVIPCLRSLAAALAIALFAPLTAHAQSNVPNPVVTGPIPENAAPGDPSHDYIFFSREGIDALGYVEEEFFFEGTANVYSTPALTTATVVTPNQPYKTRMVVRRPRNAADFNGTVIVEWQNVSAGFDIDASWAGGQEAFFLREGYAYVAVSAQRVGVQQPGTGLRDFSPVRYGSLDVTAGGTITNDALSFDIFSQAGQAIMNPQGVRPLGDLQPVRIIASGASQSAGRLNTYYNSIQPLANLYQGFMLLVSGGTLRTDLGVPVFRLLSETEVATAAAIGAQIQADNDRLRVWQVAGAAHADRTFLDSIAVNAVRDGVPTTDPATCGMPAGSEVRFAHVVNQAHNWMVLWIALGSLPPQSPAIEIVGDAPPRRIGRNPLGLANGGIRIADIEVPVGFNTGTNTGSAFCRLFGTHVDFDASGLRALYPSRQAYVNAVTATAINNFNSGFIGVADAIQTVLDAFVEPLGQ